MRNPRRRAQIRKRSLATIGQDLRSPVPATPDPSGSALSQPVAPAPASPTYPDSWTGPKGDNDWVLPPDFDSRPAPEPMEPDDEPEPHVALSAPPSPPMAPQRDRLLDRCRTAVERAYKRAELPYLDTVSGCQCLNCFNHPTGANPRRSSIAGLDDDDLDNL